MMRKIIAKMDAKKDATAGDLLKEVTVLDAIYWTSKAWKELKESTILSCFLKSGFQLHGNEPEQGEEEEEEREEDSERLQQVAQELFGCAIEDVVDDPVPTMDPPSTNGEEKEDDRESEEDEGPAAAVTPPVSLVRAQEALADLQAYFAENNHPRMLSTVIDLSAELDASVAQRKSKQMTLDSSFR